MSALSVEARSIVTSMAMTQEGSPLRIESTTSTKDFLYESVKIKNTSAERIRAVTFGVMVYALGNSQEKPALSKPVSINTNLAPGEERIIEAYTISPEDVLSIGSPKAPELLAELGVLSVQFSGGAIWSFDPVSRGGFQPNAASDGASKAAASFACGQGVIGLKSVSTTDATTGVAPAGYWNCAHTLYPVYCQNNQSSCTS
ncbi:MAG: hypothetical protein ACRD4P_08380 [Bryobacteraceae bacterium]